MLGGIIGGAIFASLTIAYLNYRSSSNLESAAFALVNEKEETILDQALLAVIRSLPINLPSLSKDQRIQLYESIGVYSKLELFKQNVLSIRDRVSWSLLFGFSVGLLAPFSGFLYDAYNWLYFPISLAAGLLLFAYIAWGICPILPIRAIEKVNRRLLEARTASEIDQIAREVLEAHFGYEFRKLF